MPYIITRRFAILFFWIACTGLTSCSLAHLQVNHCVDFDVTGDGSNPAWAHADWHALERIGEGLPYTARFKILYSKTGLYILMDGSDSKLVCTRDCDGSDLYMEDVFEFFVKTDQSQDCYFEYEISPRGYHLVLRVSGSWHPWNHEGKKRVRRATSVVGGEKKHGAAVDGWSAEFFLPYELMSNSADEPPPGPGTRWRANFYRIDYDVSDGVDPESISYWTWAPLVGTFHQVDKFGVLVFGEPAVATRQDE